ncbi:unnamed protein product [Acanthoscelides obtectus]|uniref:Uncharacterized protein n=1 Tax=Acanthoscelides obtectus TaxID=200917 RepID=A0A9P0P912_ACAOB|nr:unnamed protein product [Acanthoscelides obtectus]CAK1660510.1 hypothetical protein AOBTE_LOCUS22124 [Acanthoscelides obtectus]
MSNNSKSKKMRDGARVSDNVYVQKKKKFEPISRSRYDEDYADTDREYTEEKGGCFDLCYPITISMLFQKWWTRLALLVHGLLGGLALSHTLYVSSCLKDEKPENFVQYGAYSDAFFGVFFGLCVLCIVSVLDKIDVGHMMTKDYLGEVWRHKCSSIALVIYLTCFTIHLCTAQYDEKLALLAIEEERNTTSGYYHDMRCDLVRSRVCPWNSIVKQPTSSDKSKPKRMGHLISM